jgi:hypothetical protein
MQWHIYVPFEMAFRINDCLVQQINGLFAFYASFIIRHGTTKAAENSI